MAKWMDIGSRDNFPEGEHVTVDAGEHSVVICNVDGDLCAVANLCPHAGLPIGEGELRGSILMCPFHGYAFNVQTGKNVDFEDDMPLLKYPIQMTESGRIEVDVEACEQGQ